MSDKENRYWKAEYENLRRKKNKEIDDLQIKLSRGCGLFLQYLQEKELLDEYNEWAKLKGDVNG